jgi:CHAD domain-containing protein
MKAAMTDETAPDNPTPDAVTPAPDAVTEPQPLQPNDTINAAGRKIVHKELIRMLRQPDAVLENATIEPVHKMRVSTRRIRSVLRLLQAYYRPKELNPLSDDLRWLADQLGAARDLDVLLSELIRRDPVVHADLIATVQAERAKVQRKLDKLLTGARYQALIPALEKFSQREDKAKHLIQPPAPVQSRHIVPIILQERLAAVRGFDPLISGEVAADYETLHDLRIAFKRLRYALDFFSALLGNTADAYITELKVVQDHLGRLNDVVVFRQTLAGRLKDESHPLLADLDAEAEALMTGFATVWSRFNGRAVQQHLSNALLVLR